jgi:AcrR family transcriptional regulator
VTRTAILDAAEAIFVELGLQAPMEKIAQRADVAVGTLYNHFVDRDALIEALFAHRRAAMFERLAVRVADTVGMPFRQRLHAVIEALVVTPAARMPFRRLLVEESVSTSHAQKRQAVEHLLTLIMPLLAQGHEEHALRDDPMDMQPRFLVALMLTAMQVSVLHPRRLPQSRIADEILRQFLDGAASERGPA